MVLKGKSGWCSTICPLLPVQRLYGQTPYKLVANSHCTPCVGCTKNCYDFNPKVAFLADLKDPDPYWSGYKKLFAAAFPDHPPYGGAHDEIVPHLTLGLGTKWGVFRHPWVTMIGNDMALDEGVGDLLAEALLHGEAAREQAHQPGQLGDADDPLV
jgi:hypothetical protein